MGQSLEEKIVAALKQQGYPLEMEVANEFGSSFRVAQSALYKDPETGTMREIDVTAYITMSSEGIGLQLGCAVECKLSRDKPWVLFTSSAMPWHENRLDWKGVFSPSLAQVLATRVFFGDDLARNIEALELMSPEHVGYGLARVRVDAKDRDNNDKAYEATMGAVKAAIAHAQRIEILPNFVTGATRHCGVVFPVIVIDARLFESHLDGDGNLIVNEIPSGVLVWQNQGFASTPIVWVQVVTRPALPEFVRKVVASYQHLAEFVDAHNEELQGIAAEVRSRRKAEKE